MPKRVRRIYMKLTDQERKKLEAIAKARQTTLTGAFCALLEEKRIVLPPKSSDAGQVLADPGIAR